MLTSDEVVERLRQATEAVQAADLPDDLRTIAFERALDALGLGSAPRASAPVHDASAVLSSPRASGGSEPRPVGAPLAQIAQRFELPTQTLERIYEVEDGAVRLAMKRSMLPDPTRKAAAMRHVSLLLIAGRQAAGEEEQTDLADVRDECQALKVLDAPNFSSEIAKLDFRLQGARNKRTAKANRHHFEEAAQLIRQILREGES